jgi:hypothetical protein
MVYEATVTGPSRLWVELALPMFLESKSNSREHWAARHRHAQEQRGTTRTVLATLSRGGLERQLDLWGGEKVYVRMVRVAPRALDGDDNLNASLKSVRDGIADWLGVNDGSTLVRWEYDQRRDAPRTYGVEIKIGRWSC